MNEKEFEVLLEDYLPEEKKSGDVVEGIITRKELDFGFLDLNAKKEGRIYASEVKDFEIGDKIEVKVLREDDENIIVSKFLLDKAKELASFNVDDIVTGEIIKKIKGGYTVRIGKNEAFLPFSLARFDKNKDYTGQKFKFLIKEKNKSNITVSRSDLIKIEEEKYFENVNIGDVVTGKVKEIFDFGIILDLGATSGFIHISEVSWNQVDNLTERYKAGDEISAKIIEKDAEKNRLKLSIKQLSEDPWIPFAASHKVGDIVEAVVKDVLDFGLVVTVDGISGFVHVSELAWHNGAKELKNYKEGDKFSAKIIQVEDGKKNVKLSVKQLSENPWDTVKEKYHIGDIIEKPITEVFDFGFLISLEKDIDGLLHVSDLSYKREANLSSKYKAGDLIKFKIVDFNDEKNRITLSAKALLDDRWEVLEEIYDFDKSFTGKVMNVQDYGIFVELEKGIEVFIHKNEFSWDRKEHKEYKVGDEVEFKVIVVDKLDKKLSGSIKQLQKSPWKEAIEQYKKGNTVNTEIVEIQENFVLVKLTDRFNGIIPKRELTEEFLKDISEKFSVGDKVEAVITDINEKRKSIALSVKKVQEMAEKKEMDELMKVYGV
ncbi:S1 RNA-binding domain-containing protein [Leptotrichia sp. oral taxon 223]|uniref:S1 RNA-binding domain-containing protein n=1 Tax=Leptotrichia sp. oral taxon 223 TaxID=712363 RepID=UPI0015BCBF15|nr:S1 RNA-binding domain-containing protein [Leptotrichia sp. oral taxon 223]NWO19460.1 S1 RNA-binding domain-containing protein [Leptotrichia sp. oral taxon 223]